MCSLLSLGDGRLETRNNKGGVTFARQELAIVFQGGCHSSYARSILKNEGYCLKVIKKNPISLVTRQYLVVGLQMKYHYRGSFWFYHQRDF